LFFIFLLTFLFHFFPTFLFKFFTFHFFFIFSHFSFSFFPTSLFHFFPLLFFIFSTFHFYFYSTFFSFFFNCSFFIFLLAKFIISITSASALENSVSKYPTTAGRFFQVSGISLIFDPNSEPRIQKVTVDGKPLDHSQIYTVATKAYIANGNDGYEVFKRPEVSMEPCTTEDELKDLARVQNRVVVNFFGQTFDVWQSFKFSPK